MNLSSASIVLAFGALLPQNLNAQFVEAAIPGLTIPASPWGNGMGGVTATLPSPDAASTIANPGQLGLFSLSNLFSASTYSPKSDWLHQTINDDRSTFTTSALNAGVNLKNILSLPFEAGLGVGYSRTYWDVGRFGIPDPVNTGQTDFLSMSDTYENFSVGIGLKYVVRLGVGVTFKRITSVTPIVTYANNLYDVELQTLTPKATDFGMLLDVPLVEIVSDISGATFTVAKGIEPLVDVTSCYVKSNVGDLTIMAPTAPPIIYESQFEPEPLPKTAILGLALQAGLSARAGNAPWRVVSFSLVRQAEDVLFNRHLDGTISSKGALGDLSVGDNLLVGRTTGNVLVRKGWEIGAGEFLYIRGGSVAGSVGGSVIGAYGDANDYSTSGFSICLGGLFRGLEFASPEFAGNSWIAFIGDHVDLQYHSATYNSAHPALDGRSFHELNLVLRGLPW